MRRYYGIWVSVLVLGLSAPVDAEVRLPAIFSDHAVLESGKQIPIWGWADPGETITISLDRVSGGTKAKTTAAKDGTWRVELGPLSAGAKLTLTVEGKNKLVVKDVLVGEVWLCSGQSNMAMTVQRSQKFPTEKANAKFPEIRQFKVAAAPAIEPQKDVKGSWVVCSPETVGGFTATGYFFGRRIHQELKVPVGLINSSVGGTAVEAWTSMDVQKGNDTIASVFEPWKDPAKRKDRNHPANLFNGMIAPLIPYAIRGAIWYQGERNARTVQSARLYAKQLPLLIKDWRTRWGEDFPFYFVQLPNFKKPSDDPSAASAWAEIRASFQKTLRVPNTGMAVTIDVGEANDIHPKNKQAVGKRLALTVLENVYDKDIAGTSPLVKDAEAKKGKVIVTFQNADEGLELRGEADRSFAVRDTDNKWHWANAEVEGDRVIISAPNVPNPTAVRYAWDDNPRAVLYGKNGLPAGPFEWNFR